MIVGANMNAKLKEPGESEHDGIGKHVFGVGQHVQKGEGDEEHRQLIQ